MLEAVFVTQQGEECGRAAPKIQNAEAAVVIEAAGQPIRKAANVPIQADAEVMVLARSV